MNAERWHRVMDRLATEAAGVMSDPSATPREMRMATDALWLAEKYGEQDPPTMEATTC